ncbi:GNAT family N-acetyltransferase [Nocardia mangyaensis]|uniref:GNAT family N-acetyltransferase n=1 Tax=Nocardia mangyaensis TaxID=2213200 RepID=UPI00267739F1|nr:GNAT family N-acetyltransferase [Nocardia mangyaensis]MDO3646215.1 GNAT family N-acetyltransferase [Nocardia mangyaensis]
MTHALPTGFEYLEPIPEDRYAEWLNCWLTALAEPLGADPAVLEFYRRTYPAERGLAIADADGMVATNISLDTELVLPGGARVPAVIGTGGFCHPTQTRRGLMTRLLDRIYERAVDEGKVACADWPSEWPIYRRFGHGPAAWYDAVRIDVRRAGLREGVPGAGIRLRRVSGIDARDAARDVFTRRSHTAPGELIPPDGFWDRFVTDPASSALDALCTLDDPGGGVRQCAVIDGRGFVSYRIAPGWSTEKAPDGVVHVVDFLAVDPEAAGALWRFLFSIDMVAEIRVPRLPVDDPLRWWVIDARWLRIRRRDGMWLRLLDIPAMLTARSWATDGTMTVGVRDARGWAAGTFHLEVDKGVGTCHRTTTEPDLELDVSAMGAIVLGGTSAAGLFRAGEIRGDFGKVRLWDAMASPEHAPFLTYVL